MKTLGIILSIVVALTTVQDEKGNLSLTLTNIPNNEGKLMIGVFDQKGFLNKAVTGRSVDANGKNEITVTFNNLDYGEYAISVLHDKNGNGRMDFNQQGMPQEDWAMSGTNPPDQQPRWELAKFSFDQSDQKIKLSF